jgi:hypothetical protein
MMRFTSWLALGAAVVGLLAVAPAARAGPTSTTISVEFGIGGTAGMPTGLAPTDVAGVVPTANWNVAVGDSGALGGLIQDTNGVGMATGASVAWSSNNTWNNAASGGSDTFPGAGDHTLMNGYLDGESNNVAATATLSGLTGTAYDVYVYSESVEGSKQSGGFFINGVHVPGSGTFPGSNIGPTYVQTVTGTAGNYLFLGDVAPVGGVITITDDGTSFRIPMNGVELVQVPVPEPASLSLVLAGLGTLSASGLTGWWARRRQRA